jgi:hypothetical protein
VLDLGYRHVDVFSRRALQGNGLVVVLDAQDLSAAMDQGVPQFGHAIAGELAEAYRDALSLPMASSTRRCRCRWSAPACHT